MRFSPLAVLLATSALALPAVAGAMAMMPAPNDLPGQDLSTAGAHRMEDMTMSAKAPFDIGYGLNVLKPAAMSPKTAAAMGRVAGAVAPAEPTAGVAGHFDPLVPWPIVGLHEILLPDGRVLNYGTNLNIQNTFIYDVWDPSKGFDSASHNLLKNTTNTDIFCSFQSMIWSTGEVLITGGDVDENGKSRSNHSNNKTTIFSPAKNEIRSSGSMQYPRWYPSIVAMPNGDMVTLGGRVAPFMSAYTPEAYTPATNSWRTLTGASSSAAFGEAIGGWYYPKGFVSPAGDIFVAANTGGMWSVDPTGVGSIVSHVVPKGVTALARGSLTLPTIMYAPGKLFSIRINRVVQTIDINGKEPVVTRIADIDQDRFWANATVLPDGKIMVNGGSLHPNALQGPAYSVQIWDPATGAWTTGASALKYRLYHSIALLLPDGTVLTGAGGSPGPTTERNAELYYPPYLYLKDGSGAPAPRPTLASAPTDVTIGNNVTATVGNGDVISRVTFVRNGSVTHSTNIDQRFFDLQFTQTGTTVTATLPTDSRVLVPGYYMLFVHQNGVPSVAKIIRITPSGAVSPVTAATSMSQPH